MSTYLQFIVLGFGLGAIYAGLGSGLLLMYRATGIVNFAQAVLGAWGAFVFVELRNSGQLVLPIGRLQIGDGPVGTFPAIALGLLSAAVLGSLAYVVVFRPVRHAPELAQVVVSVALFIALTALEIIRFGVTQLKVPTVFAPDSVEIAGVALSTREMKMALVMAAVALLIWIYLRFTRLGMATRAAAENEKAVMLMGYSPHLLAIIAMAVGSAASALGLILGTTLTGLSPANAAALIVPATAVLLVARMTSVPVVLLAGLGLGAFQSVLNLWVTKDWWPTWAQSGFDFVLFFFAVVVFLLVNGRRLPSRGAVGTVRMPDVTVPRLRPVPTVLVVGGAVAALSLASGTYRLGLTNSLIMAMLCLSFVLLVGYLGQVSLAQVAFAGAAGFTLSRITMTWDLPFPVPILLAALASTVLGAIVALPAVRIRGSQLAIVTLAAAIAMERFVFGNYNLTPLSGNLVPPASFLGIDLAANRGTELNRLGFSLMVLVIVALVVLLVIRIASGNTGRAFLAVRANEQAAASSGVNVPLTKLIGFTISAFIAGLAGTLIGYSQGQISVASFSVTVGLTMLAVAYLGGITSLGGALAAGLIAPSGILYVLTTQWLDIGDYYSLATGLLLIVTAIMNPTGIAGELRRQGAWVRDRVRVRRGRRPSAAAVPAAEQLPEKALDRSAL
ncbi:ABC transporter permease [Streptomyces hirsutus]|uniref:ABC transporter permease n=1 Tax=Streptomyces hirsutus TaxID=35620 RepID=UPI003427CA30